jgi:hypothetical protein
MYANSGKVNFPQSSQAGFSAEKQGASAHHFPRGPTQNSGRGNLDAALKIGKFFLIVNEIANS